MNNNLQSIPPIRQNLQCGFDPSNIICGREPCQMGWYKFIGENYCKNKSVLDVGCGTTNGMEILKTTGCSSVDGQDIDPQLLELNKNIKICDLSELPNKSVDCITCFDVIEHVINDLEFFANLIRIAKDKVFITTPNWTRSMARNHFHCREYTIPQFVNVFFPDELWSGAPDGNTHITQLLKKENDQYTDLTRPDMIYKRLADDVQFIHSTVDDREWPHILGIFNI